MESGRANCVIPGRGCEIRMQASKKFGDENTSATLGAFTAGNLLGCPAVSGVFMEKKFYRYWLWMEHSHTHTIGNTLFSGANANLFKNDAHIINTTAMHSHSTYKNGIKLDRFSIGLSYNNVQGYSAAMGVSHQYQLNMTTFDTAVRVSLWYSPNCATTLDFVANLCHHVGGPFTGKHNLGIGLEFTHRI